MPACGCDSARIVAPPAIEPIDRLQGLLEAWAEWLARYAPRLGYSPKSVGLESGGYRSDDFDDVCAASDNYASAVIDATIDDLIPIQRAALYSRYTACVFRSARGLMPQALADAHDELLIRLRRKGLPL